MPLCFILLDNASHRDNDAARGMARRLCTGQDEEHALGPLSS